ncbi:MAG: arsenate reductase ArsC [Crocinitomicaceae bacterium]
MKNILVLCTGNSCRSQMAHGYLEHFLKDKAQIFSAGVVTHGLNILAVKFMKEDGIDISNHTSNLIDDYMDIQFDLILTVCDHANETCPYFPSTAQKLHKNFEDPSKFIGDEEATAAKFRMVRDQIKNYCQKLAQHLN